MKKYAVITGASSGIGLEFARQLAKKGYALVLTARKEDRLKKAAELIKTECEIITADLEKEEECYRFFEQIKEKDIEVFINNAGFGDCGRFAETELSKELAMIQVNVTAMHILMKLMLQKMKKQGYGYLLNVASSAGLMPAGPYMATYYATKAYVASMTQAVAVELSQEKSPVYVGCLCPGPVNTGFNQVANVEFALKEISPEQCVNYAVKKMFARKVIIVPTVIMKLAVFACHVSPRAISTRITARQQKKKFKER